MYGLIHCAVREMVQSEYGESLWRQIVTRADASDSEFLSMRSYDDEISLRIIVSAAEELGVSVDDCLEAFGVFWMQKFAIKDYGMLLDAAGPDPLTFLNNLDALHDRISTTFTNYQPPSFRVENLADGSAQVHYVSTRTGLTAFVRGLLRGIGQRFEQSLEIVSESAEATDNGEHHIFTVVLGAS